MTKYWTVLVATSLAMLLAAIVPPPFARADIFAWEYINPNVPSQGKQPSTMLTPDGAGVDAVPGASLWSRNLSMAYLIGADLTGAIASDTNLTNADLSQSNLTHARFSAATGDHGANLTDANLSGANLTNADFAGAVGCGEESCGIFTGAYLIRANLSGTDARGAKFQYATLTGANLSQANLQNANFSDDGFAFVATDLTNASLNGADARGANFQYATLTGANTNNLIKSNGRIAGVNLTAGASLVVRDYDGNNPAVGPPTGPLPIVVDQHLAMDATGVLHLVFDADPWNSTISFATGVSVTRGGTLELTVASDVNLASQVGRTIDLFDWTGVTPTGAFTVSSPYTWNLSKLYTTGEVTLAALIAVPGDYSGNGTVGPEDYNLWKASFGSTTNLAADGNGNHVIDTADYSVWRDQSGQSVGSGAALPSARPLSTGVPEPATAGLLIVAMLVIVSLRGATMS